MTACSGEAPLALAIARRTVLLLAKGFRVELTRERDGYRVGVETILLPVAELEAWVAQSAAR